MQGMFLKKSLLKLGMGSMLVSALALGVFAGSNRLVFAQSPCNTTTPTTVANATASAGTAANCDMAVSSSFSGGVLSFTNDASATTSPIVAGNNTFSFGTTISDLRNTNAGWSLQASSPTNGIFNGGTVIPLHITSATVTCTPTVSGDNSTCVNTTVTPLATLSNTTPATFVGTGTLSGSQIVSALFGITTTGGFTFPANAPAGTYSGTILITVVNSPV